MNAFRIAPQCMIFVFASIVLTSTASRGAVSDSPPDADALWRLVHEQYHWMAGLDSIQLRVESTTRTHLTGDFMKREETPQVPPRQSTSLVDFAWDKRRYVYRRVFSTGYEEKRFFDGSVLWMEFSGRDSKSYGLYKDPRERIHDFESRFFWFTSTPQAAWWMQIPTAQSKVYQAAACPIYLGKCNLHGRECHQVRSWSVQRQYYIDAADGQVRGYEYLAIGEAKATRKAFREAASLSLQQSPSREELQARWASVEELAGPKPLKVIEEWYEEFGEASPGRRYPKVIKERRYKIRGDKMILWTETDSRVVRFPINKPLADEQFAVQIPEGEQVNDWRFEAPVQYAYRKDMPQAEIDKLVAERVEKQNEGKAIIAKETAKLTGHVGQAPTELPALVWRNSKPMTWKDLRGKVVLLHFFSETCGPCKNDLQLFSRVVGKDQSDSAYMLIGVHTAGSKTSSIDELIQEYKLQYPICVDYRLPFQKKGHGVFSDWLGVRMIPWCVVVDKEGKIAGHGSLSEAMEMVARMNQGLRADGSKGTTHKNLR